MSQKENKKTLNLIWKLARNDFKTRYAGSYVGALWAMVQPVVTVLMYYIVFDKIFQQRATAVSGGIEIPYVLFLTAGLVPWFYFPKVYQTAPMHWCSTATLLKRWYLKLIFFLL